VVFVGPSSSIDFRKSLFDALELFVGQFVAAKSGHEQISEQLYS
jgi:hypothetical protein